MNPQDNIENGKIIKVLLVDDSLVFRRFLGDIFSDCDNIDIVGEAQNGIEALDMMLKVAPDVILLDMEMPLMDGMTALQHLMIHRPTPVIMFSSLSEEGTARCFDTLKNGAVDFLCKDFIFEQSSLKNRKSLIVSKVEKAGRMQIKPRNPVISKPQTINSKESGSVRVVFCEECGSQQSFKADQAKSTDPIKCGNCGDVIDFTVGSDSQYRNNNFLTLLIGGYGSYFNLLEIVPRLDGDTGGALIAVIQGEPGHVNNFAEYLDAISPMKVVRAGEGTNIEGGSCYILSTEDIVTIKPISTAFALQKVANDSTGGGAADILLASVSTLYKNRASVIILSGDEQRVESGIAMLLKNGGTLQVLSQDECYCIGFGSSVMQHFNFSQYTTNYELLETIKQNHTETKYS